MINGRGIKPLRTRSGGATVTVRRALRRSINSLPKSSGGTPIPTSPADAADIKTSASILVPLGETIEDISYVAGVQGALASSTTTNNISPNMSWNSTEAGISVTTETQDDGTLVKVEYDPSLNSTTTTMIGAGWDRGNMKGVVYLIVTTKK